MIKKNGILGFMIAFAIFFFIPPMLLVGQVGNHFKYQNILTNGIEAEATVLPNTEASNVKINDIPYYSFEFSFVDQNGDIHIGRTSASFTISEVGMYEKIGTITIKYNPKTFDAIESSYSFSNSEGVQALVIIAVVFGVVDSIFWGVVIFIIIRSVKRKKIKEEGKECTADFLEFSTNTRVNGKSMYKISYIWTDEEGNTHNGTSPSDYYYNEALAFEAAGTFKIKVKDGDSVVISTPQELIRSLKKSENAKQNSKSKCQYCGSVYNVKESRCPSCGASNNRLVE